MSDLVLGNRRLEKASWSARLSGVPGADPPRIAADLDGQPLPGLVMTEAEQPGTWNVSVDLPPIGLEGGFRILTLRDAATDQRLARIVLHGDDLPDEDLRGEVAMLRAELDLLKRAFRRHCIEKTAPKSGE